MALFGSGGDQSLNITIKAKDDASQAISKVRLSVGDLAKGFAFGNVAVDALRTGFHFLSGVVSESLHEFDDANKVAAQTNAVLESTGHAAGLTAKDIASLATSLSRVTLYQDEVVQSAENMLLTFTNITKDTFPRATRAVLDMSTALGQDLQSSAIQLGKALNNPIEGVAALQRVGVSFNNAQQEMIATMVKSGHTLEAQDFILKEIEREFGNSAQSAYEAASSVEKLQKNYKDLEEDIGRGLTPAINNLFSAFQSVTAGMGHSVDVGKVTFQVFAKIEETAAAAAAAIHAMAAGAVNTGASVLQFASKITGASFVLKQFGIDANKFFGDFKDATDEGVAHTVSFYDQLKDKNDAVIKTWGDMTESAKVLGKAAPAAYEATAEEAKKAADAIKRTNDQIQNAKSIVLSFQDAMRSDNKSVGEAVVAEQARLSDLRKQLTEEADPQKQQELRFQIDKEQAALDKFMREHTGGDIGTAIGQAIQDTFLTQFERDIKDIQERRLTQERDTLQQIVNIYVSGDINGNQGAQDILKQITDELNRMSTLKSFAGV